MKKKVMLFFVILLAISTLCGCSMGFDYYENKLYSEKDATGNVKISNVQDNNTLTREKAVGKALDVFDKGLNVKINRKEFNEKARISSGYENDALYWNIAWTSAGNKQFYQCVMDAADGKVLFLACSNNEQVTGEKNALTEKEILDVANPLLKELNIDPDSYMTKYDGLMDNGGRTVYETISLIDKKDKNKHFTITINRKSKSIVQFQADIETSSKGE